MTPHDFVNKTLADDAEIKRLAGLSILECDRQCTEAAKKLKCGISALRVAVRAERAKKAPTSATNAGQGRAIQIPEVEPWPNPVDGAAVLNTLVVSIRSYIVVTDVQADAAALWATLTYAFDAFDTLPKLVLKSPQKRSGKTRFVEVLSRLTARPLATSGIRPAALLRLIEMHHPTLMLDEMDTAMKGDREMAEALRGIMNSGFDRAAARFIMNVPTPDGGYEPREFSTWCPQVSSGIGDLADTVRDRSIEIDMQRKPRGQKVSRLRRRDGGELHEISRKLAKFAADNMNALRESEPAIPAGLNDRAADAWEPLFAIADQAGGDWPQRACQAALALSGDGAIDDENIGTTLLTDIAEAFKDSGAGHLTSANLTEKLAAMVDRPWAEWRNSSKAITPHGLARLLKPYCIVPATIRTGPTKGDTAKGYKLESFKDAFERYLPPFPNSIRNTVTTVAAQRFNDLSEPSQPNDVLRFEKCEKANNDAHCDGVTVDERECSPMSNDKLDLPAFLDRRPRKIVAV